MEQERGAPTERRQNNDTFIGINTSKPKYINQASFPSRLETYRNLPPNVITQSFESLARAGFFYTGSGDLVRCFYCGGGLRNWDSTDDPWTEHKRWFPKCDFLTTYSEQPSTEPQPNLTSLYVNSLSRLPLYIKSDEPFTPTVDKLELIIAAKAVLHLGYDRAEVGKAFEICSKRAKSPVTARQLLVKVLELKLTIECTTDDAVCAVQPISSQMSPEELSAYSIVEEENTNLKEKLYCRICEANRTEVAFLPCGHMITCNDCAPAVRYCLTCCGPVKATVKVFLS